MAAGDPWWISLLLMLLAALLGTGIGLLTLRGARAHRARLDRLGAVELSEMFLFVDPDRFLWLNLLALLVVPLLLGFTLGFWVGGMAFVLVLVAPGTGYRWMRRRRRRSLQQQLPDAASAMASGLRAGFSLGQAIEQVAKHQARPIAQEFALLLREHRLGLPLDQALQNLAQRIDLHDCHLLVTTLGVARDLGSGLAEALERFSSTVRRRLALEARIKALTAQGRMQGIIMGLLPVLLALVLAYMEPRTMRALIFEPIGWMTLAIVAILEAGGYVMIRRIVSIRV